MGPIICELVSHPNNACKTQSAAAAGLCGFMICNGLMANVCYTTRASRAVVGDYGHDIKIVIYIRRGTCMPPLHIVCSLVA